MKEKQLYIKRTLQCEECDNIFEVDIYTDELSYSSINDICPECGFEDEHLILRNIL